MMFLAVKHFHQQLLSPNVLSMSGRLALNHNKMALSLPSIGWRSLATKAPGSNPLEVIRKECINRHLCDEHGYRRPGVHWVFSLAVTPDDISQVIQESSDCIIRYCSCFKYQIKRLTPNNLLFFF
jgi:hypothetical protein